MTPRGRRAANVSECVQHWVWRVRVAHGIDARSVPRGWTYAERAVGGAVDGGCQCDHCRTAGFVGAPYTVGAAATDTSADSIDALGGTDTEAAAQQCSAHSQDGAAGWGASGIELSPSAPACAWCDP